jgi:hypothetical protein
MACEEMDLYYAYLDAVEEAKRKAQPWQCEVTVIPQGDELQTAAAPAATAAGSFACDEVTDAPIKASERAPSSSAKP